MIFQNNFALLCWNKSENEYIGPIGTIDKSTPLKASTKLRYVLVINDQCKAEKDLNPNISVQHDLFHDMPISPLLQTSKIEGRRERGGGSGVIVVEDEMEERGRGVGNQTDLKIN